jgi:hypothetical protein
MITESEKNQIQAHLKAVNAPIALKLKRTSDERSDRIHAFCNDLTRLSSHITCAEVDGDDDEITSIELATNIHYAGVPAHNELVPFMKMLTGSIDAPPLQAEMAGLLQAVSMPAAMELYVAPFCPHCPMLVEQLYPIARANPEIGLQIIDAEVFNDRSRAAGIKSVPTLIIDNVFRATGQVELEEVLAFLGDRRPSSLGAAAMESMLKEGNASKLAQMMAAEKEVFPAFLTVLTHPKWPVRLGAMVALEELAMLRPELAASVIDTLWDQFMQASDQVRGDIVYITGEIGGPQAFERITSIKSGTHAPEVCEAAIDALQALRDRKGSSSQ